MLERSLSALAFSTVSWLVLSSTTSSRWFAYFSNLSTMLSRIFAWLQCRNDKYGTVFSSVFFSEHVTDDHVFHDDRWLYRLTLTDLSGLMLFNRLRMDAKGGLWSGFSDQQAFSSALTFSSHNWSDSTGRRGSPWKGILSCIIISGERNTETFCMLLFAEYTF